MTSTLLPDRVEDIKVEIAFQQTLLDMLDQDADSYEDDKQRLEALLVDLEARLESLTGNGHTLASDESQASTYTDSLQDLLSVPAYLGTSLISIFSTKAPRHKFACSQYYLSTFVPQGKVL
jgi:hypothetical protein